MLADVCGMYAWSKGRDWYQAGEIAQLLAILAAAVVFFSGMGLAGSSDHYRPLQVTGLILGIVVMAACHELIRLANRRIETYRYSDPHDPRVHSH